MPKVKWSYHDVFQFNITDDSDITEYHNTLDNLASTIRLDVFEELNVEEMLPHVSDTLTQSAEKCFSLKVKYKRRGNRLPKSVINLIRRKNKTAWEYRHAVASDDTIESDRLEGELLRS